MFNDSDLEVIEALQSMLSEANLADQPEHGGILPPEAASQDNLYGQLESTLRQVIGDQPVDHWIKTGEWRL